MPADQNVIQFTIQFQNQVLQIDNDKFPVLKENISYVIADNEGTLYRKGSFTGKCVQMRLNGLKPGNYALSLYRDNSLIKSHTFQIH